MRYAVIFFFFFFIATTAQAQESLAKDISYEYLDRLLAVCKKNYPKIKMFEDRVSVAEYGIKKASTSNTEIPAKPRLFLMIQLDR